MLLIIEIMLSASAWKRGWKGWVVLPWAALFIGATALGSSAGSEEQAFAIGIAGDILLIVVLGIMAAAAPAGRQEHNVPKQTKQIPAHATTISPADSR